jgi:hypothetical protein
VYIYNFTTQTVAIDGAVLFDSNGPLSGFTHTSGSASIAVVSAGIHLVDFSVPGTEPDQFSLFDNASPVAGRRMVRAPAPSRTAVRSS